MLARERGDRERHLSVYRRLAKQRSWRGGRGVLGGGGGGVASKNMYMEKGKHAAFLT